MVSNRSSSGTFLSNIILLKLAFANYRGDYSYIILTCQELFRAWIQRPPVSASGLNGEVYLYGAVSGFAYSMILDIWTTVWTYGEFTFRQYGAALVSSMPYPVVYALSNLIFLMLLAKPFGEKLARIGKKYGL